jgi:cytochrome b561
MIPLGFYMVWRYAATDFDAVTVQLFDIHKLTGFVLLWLVVARLGIRLVRGVPEPVPTLHPLQRAAASVTHGLLYVMLFVVPLLGWAGSSAYDLRSLPFGFNLPEILARNPDLGGRIMWWHGWAAIVLGLLAAMHLGAALMHLVMFRDGVFQRMWPSRRAP